MTRNPDPRSAVRSPSIARRLTLAALLLGAASVSSCTIGSAPDARTGSPSATAGPRIDHRFTGTAMGVVVEITIDDDDAGRARAAARAAQEELDRLDAMLSDWKASSELSRFNACGDLRVAASAEMREVLLRALEVARASDGRFDPTVAPLVTLWRTIRRAGGLPPTQALAAERARVRYGLLEVDGEDILRKRPDVALDFGGIGKGYGAVRALAEIRRHGCPRALVAVAGDLAAGDAPRGAQGWTVAIEGERAAGETIVVANQAVSTSGGSVQWVEIEGVRYAHIVDPRTGLGATDLAQVTVVGPLDASVDALGTALALCEQDEDVVRILRAFNDHHARVERAGRAAWHPERPELPNSRRLTSDVPQSPLRGD